MLQGYPFLVGPNNSLGDAHCRPTSRALAADIVATMATELEPSSVEDDHFEVIVPLRTRYASTVRVIAASLGDRVRVTFRLDGSQLIVRLTRESGAVDVVPDDLAANILRSVVDHYDFANGGVTLSKRAAEG